MAKQSLFHRHSDFLLGHVPPIYLPTYRYHIGTYENIYSDNDHVVPDSRAASAARVHAPISDDYIGNPWHIVLAHG